MTEKLGQTAVSHKRPASSSRKVIDAGDKSLHKDSKITEGAPAADDNNKSLLTTKKKAAKPAYLQSLNESEKQANFKIIDSMNKKIAYLKNPRFKVAKAPIIMTTAFKDAVDAKAAMQNSSFRVEPTSVNFQNYQVNGIYEILVNVTNLASSSKRIKFIPPATDCFTVTRVKYPDNSSGDVAPGMSVSMAVIFQAPSFADFEDCVTFVTEETSFKLPLSAKRSPPLINLVNPLNCLNSWLGDRVDMAFRCVNSGGDGGFKFFCERDEDDSRQTDADNIKIGSFTITPCEFYLYSGNAIDVYVSFNPEQEGNLSENLILACDNQTSEFYKVNGYGAMLDLDILAVDGKEVNFKANPFETIFFENTNPTAESKRTISIKNGSPIAVPFHWSIYKEKNSNKITLEDEQTHYRCVPQSGNIKGGETIVFEMYFSPDHAEPYFEFADLIIEDVPISAIRSPPEGLKNFAAQNQPKQSKVPMPTYVGSNTQFLSIPMIQFNLRGQGNSCQVEVEPPISFIEGDTFINYDYTRMVQLKKLTQGTVNYKIRMEGQNRNFFVDLIADGKSLLAQPDGIIQGKLNVEHIDLQFKLKSEEKGLALAYFYIEIEDGPPVSFQVQADFRGPIVKISEAIVDVGLSKVNTHQPFELKVENLSPIPAELIIKSSKNKKMNFSNAILNKNSDSQVSLVVEKPVITKQGNNIEFEIYAMTLGPNESMKIKLTVNCLTEETIDEYIEVMVKESKSLFFQVLGEVQKPKVYLNRELIDFGKIFAGVKEIVDIEMGKHKGQALELINYGNLPAHFKWQERFEAGVIACSFEPSEGTIPPKSKVRISFEMTTYIGGQIDELFMCDIQDLELPIGFEIAADAFGLNVAYFTTDDQSSMLSTNSSFKSDTQEAAFNGMNALKMINFTECRINKPLTKKFLLKNLSGIATSFQFGAFDYEPLSHVAPQKKSEVQIAIEAEAARKKQAEKEDAENEQTMGKKKIKFAASTKMSATGMPDKRNKPILSDEHEQTQKFTSASGNTFTQTKVFEKDQNYFLSNNKGIAIVFNPHMGDLPPNSEVPITITIYNNVCGKFDDRLFANVKGLPPVEFPCRIAINGSPIVIPPNQVGLSYNSVYPTLPLPTVVSNTSSITKTFKIKNTGIRALQVDWKIYEQNSTTKSSDLDFFKIQVAKNTSFDRKKNPFKFNFSAIEPPETVNSAFIVEPKNVTVACRNTQEFKVTFNPNCGLGFFKSIIIASPQLAAEELELIEKQEDLPKAGSLGIIAVNMTAQTIAPYLKIDKSIKMDGERHINMKVWSNNDQYAPSNIQKLIFSNDSKADMVFNFNTQGAFEIVSSESNTGAKHPLAGQNTPSKVVAKKVETMFCLQPLKIVEIGVKFKAPKPSTTEEWPMIMSEHRHGALVANFSNGDSQKFFIEGRLLRPKIVLLTEVESKNDYAMDEMDFRTCNVDKKRTIKLFLSNITEVTAKWTLNYVKFPKKMTVSKYTTTKWEEENMQKIDDPDVFEFSVSAGSLRGKTLPLRKVPEGLCVPPVPKDEEEKQFLPQTILVNFRPKQNVLYKSKFRFTVENGLSCDVILKGKGSYEEQHD